MATKNDDIEALNKRLELLQLLAWNRFKVTHAKSVQLVSITNDEMKLEIEAKKGVKETYTHTFTESERSGSIQQRFMNAVDSYRFPTLPGGTYFIFLMWLLNGICLVDLGSLTPTLGWLQKLAFMIFQNKVYAYYAFLFLIGSHVLETCYALLLVRKIAKTPKALLGWLIINLIYGYPSTIRAMKLSGLARKSKKLDKKE